MKAFYYALVGWIIAGIAGFMLADLLLLPFFAGRFTGTVLVPDVVGSSIEESEGTLGAAGLVLKLDSVGEYSTDIKAGLVLKQRPSSTSKVKKGRRIWVTISKGLKSVEVPDLKGGSLRQAEITLQQMGLQMGELIKIAQPGIPLGVVFDSDPPATSEVEIGSQVSVFISSGSQTVFHQIRNLSGMSFNRAVSWIERLGMTVGNIEKRPAANTLPNTVLEQSPPPGSPVVIGGMVNIVISENLKEGNP